MSQDLLAGGVAREPGERTAGGEAGGDVAHHRHAHYRDKEPKRENGAAVADDEATNVAHERLGATSGVGAGARIYGGRPGAGKDRLLVGW